MQSNVTLVPATPFAVAGDGETLVPVQGKYPYVPMDYKDEWVFTQAVLPPYLCLRYWKHQVVAIDDREELVFYRQQELREHAPEIDQWAGAGYNVMLAWSQIATKCTEEMKKGRSHYNSPLHPQSLLDQLTLNPQRIDFAEVQQKVNRVIRQLHGDLTLLQKLEPQWIGCESWERVKVKQEAERLRQEAERAEKEREEQARVERERQTRLAAEGRAEKRMSDAMWEAHREWIEEQRGERVDRQEQRRRGDLVTYADPVLKAEEKLESELREFRRRHPAQEDDLSHCETESTWRDAWRKRDPEDYEPVFDRYERLEHKLKAALDEFVRVYKQQP